LEGANNSVPNLSFKNALPTGLPEIVLLAPLENYTKIYYQVQPTNTKKVDSLFINGRETSPSL